VIDRATVKKLRDEMLLEIGAVAEKHGLKAEAVRATFDTNDATFTFRLTQMGEAGDAAERAHFARHASLVGLAPDLYGRTFTHGGHLYFVLRINPRARSTPVICRRMDGKLFKFPAELVRSQTKQES
jgi:hypothetical protein